MFSGRNVLEQTALIAHSFHLSFLTEYKAREKTNYNIARPISITTRLEHDIESSWR